MANDGSRATRMLRRTAASVLASLLALTVSTGCKPTNPPTSSPTPTGIFASEEEALAAATDVYQQYNAAFDSALANGGADMSGMKNLVTQEHFVELEKPGIIDTNGWHTNGTSTFEVKSVSSYRKNGRATEIALNVCRELASVRVLDSSGTDVTPSTWPAVVPLTVSLESPDSRASSLLVSKVDSWLDQDAC